MPGDNASAPTLQLDTTAVKSFGRTFQMHTTLFEAIEELKACARSPAESCRSVPLEFNVSQQGAFGRTLVLNMLDTTACADPSVCISIN